VAALRLTGHQRLLGGLSVLRVRSGADEIPTYKVGNRRLYVGAWKHGLSIYGWQQGRDDAFTSRHPALKTSKGTLQLRPEDAAAIPDCEISDLVRAALDA